MAYANDSTPPVPPRSWWERIPGKIKVLGAALLTLATVAGVSWNARGRVVEYVTHSEIIEAKAEARQEHDAIHGELIELKQRAAVTDAEMRTFKEWLARVENKLDRSLEQDRGR